MMTSKPKGWNTYSFVAEVNSKKMEFVSEKEYEEYIKEENPIQIIKRHYVEYPKVHFRMKVVLYRRISDDMLFVYRVSQYYNDKPTKEVYTFTNYCDAFYKYKEKGGK